VVDFLTFYLILAACWGAGAWMRAWRAGEAQRSRLAADQAITEERARIARELHDVVTHHVTAMVVQADAAGYLVSSPERLTEGLTAISATGRRALAELRYLLGVLDAPPSASPPDAALRAPALGDLADLAAQTRRGGQPVELTQDGEPPPMAAATQLAAYRVVQEALTNAVKHAPGQRTVVRIRYGDAIDIEAVTDGPPGPPGPPGRGLTGLGERVRSCGGELRAGARPEGGFSVAARIPLETAP
jgi:signal transduction histidine kinase